MIFTLVHVSLALLSLRKSGGLLVAYFEKDISAEKMSSSNEQKFDELLRRRIVRQPRNFAERRLLVQVITRFRVQFGINKHKYTFSKANKIARARMASAICGLTSAYYSKLHEKNHVITY